MLPTIKVATSLKIIYAGLSAESFNKESLSSKKDAKRNLQSHLYPPELADYISRSGDKQAQARQVAKRLHTLLPQRLKEIEREYRRRHPPAKAHRLALSDRRYLDFIEQAAEITAAALESRVIWETHRLLFEARRSIQSYRRVLMLSASETLTS